MCTASTHIPCPSHGGIRGKPYSSSFAVDARSRQGKPYSKKESPGKPQNPNGFSQLFPLPSLGRRAQETLPSPGFSWFQAFGSGEAPHPEQTTVHRLSGVQAAWLAQRSSQRLSVSLTAVPERLGPVTGDPYIPTSPPARDAPVWQSE